MARTRSLLAVLAALVAAALSVTGCVSMPTAGPVQSYPVTQGTASQNPLYVQIQPQPPHDGWSPKQIVQGFLTASASFGSYSGIAKEYLTPQEREVWNPFWSAIVYKSGPNVKDPVFTSPKDRDKDTATVQIDGRVQAYLTGNGSYSVSSTSAPDPALTPPTSFGLVRLNGEWRIADAPQVLLLTNDSFQYDYQLTKLYFFDPSGKILVPDPVYVPLQAGGPTGLITGLVNDLISPPKDWLSGGTKTAFPAGTRINRVTIDGGIAFIDLGGTIAKTSKASLTAVMQQVSSQLLWTLLGATQSGQAVQAVEVELNGKQWIPPKAQGNPVQPLLSSRFNPANGPSLPLFYAIDKAGYLTRRASTTKTPVPIVHIGTGFQQIAVSPSGKYLAALRDSVLYTAPLGDPLVKRGSGYLAISWDISDQLWASTQTQIFMLRGAASPQQPLGQPVPVKVIPNGPQSGPPYTSLRVAPDGVRVALISGGNALRFGAIEVQQEGLRPGQVNITITLSQVQDLPVSGFFTPGGLSWYGSDSVITLTDEGPAVTEYPVSGAPYTPIPADTELQSITASYNHPLIAGLPHGRMVEDVSLQGAWMPIGGVGTAPAYPG